MSRVPHLWEAAEQKARYRALTPWGRPGVFKPHDEYPARGDFGLTIYEWPAVLAAANAHRRGQWWFSVGIAAALVAGFALGAWQ